MTFLWFSAIIYVMATTVPTNPVPLDLLEARRSKNPNYVPFQFGANGAPSHAAKLQYVTIDVPYGKRGSTEVRNWAKQCGARFDGTTKEWRVAGEELLRQQPGNSGFTNLEILNSLRLISGFKAYTPGYVARNFGLTFLWARVPYSQRAEVKALPCRALWDTHQKAWRIPVLPNDPAYAKAIAAFETRGWIDVALSELPSVLVPGKALNAVTPKDHAEAEATVFTSPAQAAGFPGVRRSSTRSRLHTVYPPLTPPTTWFHEHQMAAEERLGGSRSENERAFCASLLDFCHMGDWNHTEKLPLINHYYLRSESDIQNGTEGFAAAFDFFSPTGTSVDESSPVRVGFFLPDNYHPLRCQRNDGDLISQRRGWNWAYMRKADARQVWNDVIGKFLIVDSTLSETLNTGRALGSVVGGVPHDLRLHRNFGAQAIPAALELLIVRAGRCGTHPTATCIRSPFALPIQFGISSAWAEAYVEEKGQVR